MSDPRSEPGYYRTKAGHMRRLANQAQNETARATYLLLEASWLRLAENKERKNSDQPVILDGGGKEADGGGPWSGAVAEAGGDSGQAAK